MHEAGAGSLLIGDPESEAEIGIITERDIVRAVAVGGSEVLKSSVRGHGSHPLIALDQEAFVYQALGRIHRLGIRYLGITDANGRVVGVVSARSLLQARTTHAILVGDRIADAQNSYELAAAADELPTLSMALLEEGMRATAVAAVVSDVLRHITARAAALAEQQLAAHGYGPAPVPWCLLVLGSAGRGESLLSPDQDNAIAHLGSPQHDPWFKEFADRLVCMLDEAGIPYCKGEIMANNSDWRRSLASWREEIERWVLMATESSRQNINVFYDLEPVYGDHRIAAELRDIAIQAAAGHEHTLARLARAVAGLRPPIGMFGRFELHNGRMDLKPAVLPLVAAARVLALLQGSTARTTPDRLREASTDTLLPTGEAEALIDLHGLLLDVLLKQQLQDLRDGILPSYRVDVSRLDADETDRLRHGLRHLDKFLGRVPEYCVRT
jgi:signal-transduction protein with cAMP-binding, CBS, and nucleotidyltransferase domain